MSPPKPALLAVGPWSVAQVESHWRKDTYEPAPEAAAAADEAIAALSERGSPAHDGLSARLADYTASEERLVLELQPSRWALRLVDSGDSRSLAALCVTRAADGRWLAGRRAQWLASWAGRWALGAGGAVEVGESAAETLVRELEEEWSVIPDLLTVEALIGAPSGVAMLVGQAWLPDGAEPVPDHEHDAWAWWPADPEEWPREADEPLRRMAALLTGR